MNGLHVCKPGNAPQVGQIKTFTINGDRIKSAPADKGGQPYKIVQVVQSSTYKDSYGNLGFNLEIEPAGTPSAMAGLSTPPASTGQTATKQGGLSHSNNDDRSNRIERQHSQHMFLLACQIKGSVPETAKEIRAGIDWWQRDISRQPLSAIEQQGKTMFNATEADETQPPTIGDGPDDEPF